MKQSAAGHLEEPLHRKGCRTANGGTLRFRAAPPGQNLPSSPPPALPLPSPPPPPCPRVPTLQIVATSGFLHWVIQSLGTLGTAALSAVAAARLRRAVVSQPHPGVLGA